MLNTIAALCRPRRSVAPPPGPTVLHFKLGALSTPCGVALNAAAWEAVYTALAPALAREAQDRPRAYHLADDAGCGIPLGDFGPAHLAGPGEGQTR